MSYNHVLDFWFGKLEDGFADQAHRKRWYKSSEAFDNEIRQRFGSLLEDAVEQRLGDWFESPAALCNKGAVKGLTTSIFGMPEGLTPRHSQWR